MIRKLVIPNELGEGIEVRLLSWCRAEGDSFQLGDALLEFETDKAIVLVSAGQAGAVKRVFYSPGDWMKPGDVAAWLSDVPDESLADNEPSDVSLLSFETT